MENDTLCEKKLGKVRLAVYDDVEFIVDENDYVQVYIDGACKGNGTPQAVGGIGVYFCPKNPYNVSERIKGLATNNKAEMYAAFKAINIAYKLNIKRLGINCDSLYVVKIATEWLTLWKQNSWKLSNGKKMKNEAELHEFDKLLNQSQLMKRYWRHINAHIGIAGNEHADSLAKAAIED